MSVGGVGIAATRKRPTFSQPQRLPIEANVLLKQTPKTDGYTVIEFLDYQCPPCRASQKPLHELLSQKGRKVRLLVRNLPLSMHPNAFSAAVAAEAAREQNKFEPVHNALLDSAELDEKSITDIAQKQKINLSVFEQSRKSKSKQQVLSDMKLADSLHIESTPSFVLCCPNGDVLRLRSYRQIKELVQ